MSTETAKHFVLQLGSLASLYLSLAFLLVLLFGIINLRFPDPAEGYWALESAATNVRLGIAMVVVFFPTYLMLTRTVNRLRRAGSSDTYLSLTKWLVYLSLLVGGGVLLGDLVAVIMNFLEGELTQRFLLKAFAVFVVTGTAFHYYLLDARGHWLTRERASIMFGIGAAITVFVAVSLGIGHIETPAEVRERTLDEKQLTDLQDIQWRIMNHYSQNGSLPPDIDTLFDTGETVPVSAPGRPDYRYEITDKGFLLCASFQYASQESLGYRPIISNEVTFQGLDDWQHGSGDVCFNRSKLVMDNYPHNMKDEFSSEPTIEPAHLTVVPSAVWREYWRELTATGTDFSAQASVLDKYLSRTSRDTFIQREYYYPGSSPVRVAKELIEYDRNDVPTRANIELVSADGQTTTAILAWELGEWKILDDGHTKWLRIAEIPNE